ncbi:MAG: hypothetical protein P4M08_15035 [Oligoflexia bacterium]|nr:hypothetical protein [Oligoflexia bacterium]
MISDSILDSAWHEVADQSSPEALIEKMAEAQPALADFLAEAASIFESPDAVDLVYFMVLVVWRACGAVKDPLPLLSESAIAEAYRQAEAWAEGFGAAPGGAGAILAEKKLQDYRSYPEPHLMAFVIQAVLDCVEDGLELTPEDQIRALVIAKAVVDVLSSS